MLSRNLKIKYRRSILGVFWTLLNPVALATIYYFVFKLVLKVDVPNYVPFILSGVLCWAFFSSSIAEATDCLVGNMGLLTKVPIPIQIFPLVGVLTNFVTLAIAVPVVAGAAFMHGLPVTVAWVFLPLYGFFLFGITYSFAVMVAIGYVYFRDLKHLVALTLQLWFYATPVVYNEKMVPERFHWILALNPLGQIFCGIHQILLEGVLPSISSVMICVGWVFAFLGAAIFLFKWLTQELVESL